MRKQLCEPFELLESPQGDFLIIQPGGPVLVLAPDGRLLEAPAALQAQARAALAANQAGSSDQRAAES